MDASLRKEFVRTHRTAVFGYQRKSDGPAMSIVYYVMDGDDILVSTMRARGKAGAVRRNSKVSLCVLDEKWPPTYMVVYCDARVETNDDAVTDLAMKIAGVMAGRPMPEAVRPMIAEGAKKEERVVLRLTPYATFYTPPRHVSSEADLPALTHETSASIPW
ncbi:MAG: pyridoxamine 5'-phosphate oxidase family protein [Chloroflexota bacterium]